MVDILYSQNLCNSYLLISNNNAIIVDPGDNTNNRLINHIEKLKVNIVAILITHAHYDHIAALEDVLKHFPDAITYISDDEIDLLNNSRLNLSKYWVKELTFLPKKIIGLVDYEKLNICGYEIKMIKTPFHTKGSCCYYLKDNNILFTGDTLFYSSIGRSDLPTGSKRDIKNSLSKLLFIDDKTLIYPGHGCKTTMERERKHNTYLKYL